MDLLRRGSSAFSDARMNDFCNLDASLCSYNKSNIPKAPLSLTHTMSSRSSSTLLQVRTGLEEPLLQQQTTTQHDDEDDNHPSEHHLATSAGCSYFLWDRVCLLLILPSLLCLQFAMALQYNALDDKQEQRSTCSTFDVGTAICLFVVTSYLYKQCLNDSEQQADSSHWPAVFHLLPEILVDIVLGMVLLVSVDAALTTLLWATLIMSLAVISSTARHLWNGVAHVLVKDEDNDDEKTLLLV